MSNTSNSDKFAALAVALMLILTAWGNSFAMMAFGLTGIVIGLLFFRNKLGRGGLLAAIVGFVTAVIIALLTKFL